MRKLLLGVAFASACSFLSIVSAVAETRDALSVSDQAIVFQYDKMDPYDRTNEYGFNHAPSVTQLSDGRLMAAWFSGPYEGSVHQAILGSYSSDDGKTWTPAQVVQDVPRASDFDPSFLKDGDRTWLFHSAGRWNRYPFVGIGEAQKRLVGLESFSVSSQFTDDGGKTWSDPVPLDEAKGVGVRSNGIKLSTGELILPRHGYEDHACYISKSSDDGKTWKLIRGPIQEKKIGSAEPCVAETSTGELLMVVRSRDGYLWFTRSTDKGDTWSDLNKTDIPAAASSHSLIRLSDGRLLLTHNPSAPPERSPLTARLSNDEGRTWGDPIEIAKAEPVTATEGAWSSQVSYPSVIELKDGSIGVVWTEITLAPEVQRGIIHFARMQSGQE